MAVYKRNYKRYHGPLTDARWRFTILARYSCQSVFESRLFSALFVLCFGPLLVVLGIIYLHANLSALSALGLPANLFAIDSEVFRLLFTWQTVLSFLLVTFVGPGLVSPDLANNALPLYLSRPFSRKEYVLGKLTVLLGLASTITWIPGLLLVGIQSNLEGLAWLRNNIRIPIGLFIGSWLWILTISLIALALSAWVKWKPVAWACMLGIFFVATGFGEAANALLDLDTKWGILISPETTMGMMWNWLLKGQDTYREVPAWTGLLSLLSFCAFALYLLSKKIRECEVVR
jgi:ABC-2 type transport system permease protein